MFEFEARIEGLAELEKKLLALPEKVAEKVFKAASRKAAAMYLREARASARRSFRTRTGRLSRGIGTQLRVKGLGARGAAVTVKIGLRNAAGNDRRGTIVPFYGRILHGDWRAIGRGSGRRRRALRSGRLRQGPGGFRLVRGKPWLAEVAERNADRAVGIFADRLRSDLEAIAR